MRYTEEDKHRITAMLKAFFPEGYVIYYPDGNRLNMHAKFSKEQVNLVKQIHNELPGVLLGAKIDPTWELGLPQYVSGYSEINQEVR